MTHPVWPVEVPGFDRNVTEARGDGATRFQPSAGVALVRRRFSSVPTVYTGTITLITNAEKTALSAFYVGTLQEGVLRFHFPDPNVGFATGQAPSTDDPLWRFRGPPTYTHLLADDGQTWHYRASVDMEKLP